MLRLHRELYCCQLKRFSLFPRLFKNSIVLIDSFKAREAELLSNVRQIASIKHLLKCTDYYLLKILLLFTLKILRLFNLLKFILEINVIHVISHIFFFFYKCYFVNIEKEY